MKFYNVSKWPRLPGPSTKGTREKIVLAKPGTEDIYFLKFPMVRADRDYTPEKWSEIIAYKVGNLLGFNVLRYDLAVYNGRVGCISKNMITPSNNESLVEGHSILSRYDSTYDPSDKNAYNRYTFEFVYNALKSYNADFYVKELISTLVFDAIIGNSDRHQSNWGIIHLPVGMKGIPLRDRHQSNWGIIHLIEKIKSIKRRFTLTKKVKREILESTSFVLKAKAAPIYDSGCCLGREFGEQQIQQHLDIQSKFDSYIRKGIAELRINETDKKPSHEELLRFIKNTNNGKLRRIVKDEINRVLKIYTPEEVNNLILNIDNNLPEEYREKYGLTDARKEFILRVIDTRINNLKNI